jgi:hypothetical protein
VRSISRHPGIQSSRHECDGRVECALQIVIRKTEDGILEIVKGAKLDVTIEDYKRIDRDI